MAAGRETDEQLTEYEKQRLSRIRENEARLEALGLRSLAASPLLRNPSPGAAKGKQKKRSADEDEEYVPSDSGGVEEDDESSSESAQDEEVEGEGKSASRSRAKGKKKKLSKSGKSTKSTPTKGSASLADVVDDDAALQQAIALSLAEYSEKPATALGAETSSTVTGASESTPHKNNSKASVHDTAKNKKIKKLGKSRIQLTEDDVVAFFFSFDEVGKGYITPWDLERMATINDFIWTDSEISKMIRCFDSDSDGKINLEDFRSIVSQCNMLQEHEK
ncbi:hypothetical protein BDA96_06G176200 [Sorghum bicolor]|uniref:EF-hand domain-containing protein n=2 Tax=Sorghum bicolor TaxID=4558 RepID=A0A921QS06_SORBI|nr:uncharacterized protein LOC8083320 [Sorghum bicolor]EES11183.1 hypothetical protein SORBI_3006G160100 [Sorghum bicolor]KAG0526786.1 hypothetical protein BDA96_06G176200 [Sorghum bicolor]|eukprot:XP_002446855.1 uncharacterized protein LOC8083320 [Sorghum bicolor]